MSSSSDADDTDYAALAAALSPDEAKALMFDWPVWAAKEQLEPEGDWTTWLMVGGRGAGKTRAGAEWVRKLAAENVSPIAIVGPHDERGHCRDGARRKRAAPGVSPGGTPGPEG